MITTTHNSIMYRTFIATKIKDNACIQLHQTITYTHYIILYNSSVHHISLSSQIVPESLYLTGALIALSLLVW